jgi:hypothetical protein
MFYGAHLVLDSSDPDVDRAFLREVLELRAVDAGHGWLIFALPPAELAVHPAAADAVRVAGSSLPGSLYLMCDDLPATVAALAAKGVICAAVDQAAWGSRTTITLPSGGTIGLYQPRHPTALDLEPR